MNNKKPISSEETDPAGTKRHAGKTPTGKGASSEAPAADAVRVAPFVYRPAPGWTSAAEVAAAASIVAAGAAVAGVSPVAQAENVAEVDPRVAEKHGWERGFREGIAKGRAENEAIVAQMRDSIGGALTDFVHERQSYFLHVEGEVVSLALAVVRKILHRESQVDPLLLTGLVRVALEKMSASQNVRLRVHPSQVRMWQDYFFKQGETAVSPEIEADAAMEIHQCRIEADHGVTDLHIEAQLKEIEQGLFDLLAQRPASK
jgi:flagellar biosynthesis/type III secretory pathway protein FliH